jgi:hypothetical protein
MMTSKLIMLLCLLALPFCGLACEEEGPMERAGERMDNTADEVGDDLEEAGEEVDEAIDDLDDRK